MNMEQTDKHIAVLRSNSSCIIKTEAVKQLANLSQSSELIISALLDALIIDVNAGNLWKYQYYNGLVAAVQHALNMPAHQNFVESNPVMKEKVNQVFISIKNERAKIEAAKREEGERYNRQRIRKKRTLSVIMAILCLFPLLNALYGLIIFRSDISLGVMSKPYRAIDVTKALSFYHYDAAEVVLDEYPDIIHVSYVGNGQSADGEALKTVIFDMNYRLYKDIYYDADSIERYGSLETYHYLHGYDLYLNYYIYLALKIVQLLVMIAVLIFLIRTAIYLKKGVKGFYISYLLLIFPFLLTGFLTIVNIPLPDTFYSVLMVLAILPAPILYYFVFLVIVTILVLIARKSDFEITGEHRTEKTRKVISKVFLAIVLLSLINASIINSGSIFVVS
ncbi:MAG: hypothetical protein AAGU75_23090, partial [Bacillota bacterium]